MKHYQELTDVENVSIALESITSLLSAVVEATESLQKQTLQTALWNIEKQLKDLDTEFQIKFQNLWEVIRNEEIEKPKSKATKSKNKV